MPGSGSASGTDKTDTRRAATCSRRVTVRTAGWTHRTSSRSRRRSRTRLPSSTPTLTMLPPEQGQAVLVRGRPAAVRDVRAHTGNDSAAHLVEIEYLDGWEFPAEDTVLWEAEVDARVLQGGGLPRVGDGIAPDSPDRFAAFCDALRWSSVARLSGLTGDVPALVSPAESAV